MEFDFITLVNKLLDKEIKKKWDDYFDSIIKSINESGLPIRVDCATPNVYLSKIGVIEPPKMSDDEYINRMENNPVDKELDKLIQDKIEHKEKDLIEPDFNDEYGNQIYRMNDVL